MIKKVFVVPKIEFLALRLGINMYEGANTLAYYSKMVNYKKISFVISAPFLLYRW